MLYWKSHRVGTRAHHWVTHSDLQVALSIQSHMLFFTCLFSLWGCGIAPASIGALAALWNVWVRLIYRLAGLGAKSKFQYECIKHWKHNQRQKTSIYYKIIAFFFYTQHQKHEAWTNYPASDCAIGAFLFFVFPWGAWNWLSDWLLQGWWNTDLWINEGTPAELIGVDRHALGVDGCVWLDAYPPIWKPAVFKSWWAIVTCWQLNGNIS